MSNPNKEEPKRRKLLVLIFNATSTERLYLIMTYSPKWIILNNPLDEVNIVPCLFFQIFAMFLRKNVCKNTLFY